MKKTVLVPQVPNGELTRRARESLKGKLFITSLILFAVFLTNLLASFVVEAIFTGAAKNFINGIITVICHTIGMGAYFKYCGMIADGKDEADFFGSCVPFTLKRFARATLADWLSAVIVFLFSLLLIIPGIIAYLNYILVPFIMFDDENVNISDALKHSKRLMYGHRWQVFYLGCRFLGWGILCIFTLGIGFLWLIPYMITSYWHFYRSVIPEEGSSEAQELPPISPCSEMSLCLRIAVFILLVIFSAANDRIQDWKSAKMEKKIEQSLTQETAPTAAAKPQQK